MKVTIWYMYKPGEERTYAMTIPPAPEWAEIQKEKGFKLFECLVDIPHEVVLEGYGDEVPGGTSEVDLGPARTVQGCTGCGAPRGTHMMLCKYAGTSQR